jgi:hypothetical protein
MSHVLELRQRQNSALSFHVSRPQIMAFAGRFIACQLSVFLSFSSL